MPKMLLTFLVFFSIFSQADDSEIKNQVNIENHPLVLLGQGWRKASWLSVKVYHAALYVKKEDEKKNPLKTKSSKYIKMKFERSISKDDLKRVWKESFQKSCSASCKVKFNGFLKDLQPINEGHYQTYFFKPNFVKVDRNVKVSTYKEKGFSQLLLSTWIGEHPPTDDLKESLLGKNGQ